MKKTRLIRAFIDDAKRQGLPLQVSADGGAIAGVAEPATGNQLVCRNRR